MRAVVFGAGRLGCGLVAQVLRGEGYEVDLVARNPALAEHLTRVGGYRVRLSNGMAVREIDVSGVGGLPLDDRVGVARAVSRADLVATTVGLAGLPGLADVLSAGCKLRGRAPLNVLTFENGTDPADPADGFVVDAARLAAPLPGLPGMRLTRDFGAWTDRRLAMFSAGHTARNAPVRIPGRASARAYGDVHRSPPTAASTRRRPARRATEHSPDRTMAVYRCVLAV